MASVSLFFQITFDKKRVPKLRTFLRDSWRSSLVLPYTFAAHTRPTFFELWSRCPTVMLHLPGDDKPFMDLNAQLMSMPSHVLEAHEWKEEYADFRDEFRKRVCDEALKRISKQMAEMREAYGRLTDRQVVFHEYLEKLERGVDEELPLFDN